MICQERLVSDRGISADAGEVERVDGDEHEVFAGERVMRDVELAGSGDQSLDAATVVRQPAEEELSGFVAVVVGDLPAFNVAKRNAAADAVPVKVGVMAQRR